MAYRIRRVAPLIVFLATMAVSTHAQQTESLPADKLEKIERAITAQMSRLGIPGLSVLVKQETLNQMWTSMKTRDGKETRYGFGWGVDLRNGMKEVHHGGAQQRVSTFLYTIPEKGLAVVLMTNLENIGGASLSREIADIVLQ